MAGPFGPGALWVYCGRDRIGLAHEGTPANGVSALVVDWDADRTAPSTGTEAWRLKRDAGSAKLDARADFDRFASAEALARRALSPPGDRKRDLADFETHAWPGPAARIPGRSKLEVDPGFVVKLLGWDRTTELWTVHLGFVHVESNAGQLGRESWWIGSASDFQTALGAQGVLLRAPGVAKAGYVDAKAYVLGDATFAPKADKLFCQSNAAVVRGLTPP